MNSIKPYLSRTSPMVIAHIEQLLEHIPELPNGFYEIRPQPRLNLTTREYDLFWRYHGHFIQEFVVALCNVLPKNAQLVEYDHMRNLLKVEVTV